MFSKPPVLDVPWFSVAATSDVYRISWFRAPPYFVGIGLAWLLRATDGKTLRWSVVSRKLRQVGGVDLDGCTAPDGQDAVLDGGGFDGAGRRLRTDTLRGRRSASVHGTAAVGRLRIAAFADLGSGAGLARFRLHPRLCRLSFWATSYFMESELVGNSSKNLKRTTRFGFQDSSATYFRGQGSYR